MNKLINIIRKIINKFDVDIVRLSKTKPINFINVKWNHPLELINKSQGQDIILSVPIKDIYFQGERASSTSQSFYIKTIVEYLSGKCTTYEGSYLQKFYKEFQPENAAEFLRLEVDECSELLNIDAWSTIFPWEECSPSERKRKRINNQVREAKEAGYALSETDGNNQFGPVSCMKGKMEFHRLIKIVKSIQQHGYQSRYGYPKSYLFLNDKKYVFYIYGGNHRVAAMVALGYTKICLKLSIAHIKRFNEYYFWKNYISNMFNKNDINSFIIRFFK